jgi:hypothetical protein
VPLAQTATADLDAWRTIVERIRAVRPPLASVFEHAMPIEVAATGVVIGFDTAAAFLALRAAEPDALDLLTREVRGFFGAHTRVELRSAALPAQGLRTVAAIDAERRAADITRARAAVESHPLVQEAIRLFGAQLRDVRLPPDEG